MILQGDIKFFYFGTRPDNLNFADIRVEGYELVRDPGFETSTLIQIFTDGRADPDDKLPEKNATRRGWWGNALLETPIGSKLWLLERRKIDSETLTLAAQYLKDALQYKIEDKEADKIETQAQRGGDFQINYFVLIIKKDGSSIFFKFFHNWNLQILGGLN